MTAQGFIDDLVSDQQPLKYSALVQLSDMSSEQVVDLKSAWVSASENRRRDILGKLVELCEDNLELDFIEVFRAGLEDEDEDVRERAARGLWDCEDRTIIRPLVTLLRSDPSAKVRAAAALSLRKFATLGQDGKLLARDSESVKETLLNTIASQDEDVDVKRRAIEAVSYFDSPETDEIIREAHQGGDPYLKQSAIYGMGQSSNAKWLTTVMAEMEHEDAEIRYEAVTAMGLLGEDSAVPHLILMVQDEDPQVQVAAVRSLGQVGGPLAKRALQRCLELGDEALEEAAREALEGEDLDEDPLSIGFEP